MAAEEKISHSCPQYTCGYGENVAKVRPQDRVDGVLSAIDLWYGENADYNYKTGKPTSPDAKVGHFTANVWKNTTHVGFGVKRQLDGFLYIVAQFSPPGNWDGDYPANVLPP